MTPRDSVLLGLIGSGIAASLTPALHEREGDAQGLRVLYKIIDLNRLGLDLTALPDLLLAAERMGFNGLNITHPAKQAVIPLLHELSPEAALLGAVNTVVLRDGKRFGHNTDWWGFAESFRRGMPGAAMDRVVQMGAGGAGAAVAYAAMILGTGHLTIVDPDQGKADSVAAMLATRFGADRVATATDPEVAVAAATGLINTSPIGMAKYPGTPLAPALLHAELWVAEIIYFPLETALLRAARALGCRTLDGGGMAVMQAVGAFEHFTGCTADGARMRSHFAGLVGNS
jgi:shikimate dehydrogenase